MCAPPIDLAIVDLIETIWKSSISSSIFFCSCTSVLATWLEAFPSLGEMPEAARGAPQHCLYFFVDPHGHGALRPGAMRKKMIPSLRAPN